MLQYHADFVSSVTMLLCNYISPILASYFVTRVLRNEREKKKISLLSTLLLPCRDNVNVFILFSHSETQTRASLSLSLLFYTIAFTNCSYRNNLLATLSQLSRKLASRYINPSACIVVKLSLPARRKRRILDAERNEKSTRMHVRCDPFPISIRISKGREFGKEEEEEEEFESLTRLTDVHVHVAADTVGESRIQQLVHAESAALCPSKRVLTVGIDSPAIGAPPRQTHNRDQRQQSHLDSIVEISVPSDDECAFHPPPCNHPRP